MIEYRFRVPSAAVFTLYSYSKALEYPLEYLTAGSLIRDVCDVCSPNVNDTIKTFGLDGQTPSPLTPVRVVHPTTLFARLVHMSRCLLRHSSLRRCAHPSTPLCLAAVDPP
jgi:hypothetical protein